jgi:hypothetical protein
MCDKNTTTNTLRDCSKELLLKNSQNYNIQEISEFTGKSVNLIYRRLTENPRRYEIRFARKEGERWMFYKKFIDEAIAKNEPLIRKEPSMKYLEARKDIGLFIKRGLSR